LVYLDYSATTPVKKEVLDTFNQVTKEFIGNANSLHYLGLESKKLMETAVEQVARILKVQASEVIFTSGASEANNLAILGVVFAYPKRNKYILTTELEHSSIESQIPFLEELGYQIDFIALDEYGKIDKEDLLKKLKNDPSIVSINMVNSELGIKQDVSELGKIIHEHSKAIFHVDGTQAVGKIAVDLENIDLFSFSAHKFYGLKGIGVLVKKNAILLTPLIHGGKSQSEYRSGTPALALMASCAKALRLAIESLDVNVKKVQGLHDFLLKKLQKMSYIIINSNEYSIPHIINISIIGIKPETMLHALSEKEVYISTKTACSSNQKVSSALKALKKDEQISSSSLRISISHLTTKEELEYFLKALDESYHELEFESRLH